MNRAQLIQTLGNLFTDGNWPKPFHVLRGIGLIEQGTPVNIAAESVGTTRKRLEVVSSSEDPIRVLLEVGLTDLVLAHHNKAAQMLGGLLLGRCAEIAFERIYTAEMEPNEFELRDLREGRTDTDYRLYNGHGRPIYRINIKFHGSQFRRAKELVGLEPDDCFALATYKINGALIKQEDEGLPYFFAIVGVPHLTGADVGQKICPVLVDTVALVDQSKRAFRKRDFEDAVINHLVQGNDLVFQDTLSRILDAKWFILSARRADKFLREFLFDRVFALKVRNFSRAFRGAELDMHFSLSNDLIPLRQFLRTLREGGQQMITTLMERGDY